LAQHGGCPEKATNIRTNIQQQLVATLMVTSNSLLVVSFVSCCPSCTSSGIAFNVSTESSLHD